MVIEVGIGDGTNGKMCCLTGIISWMSIDTCNRLVLDMASGGILRWFFGVNHI